MPNLRHAFVSAKSDLADATLVRPSNWNANLQYTDSLGAPSGTDATVREVLTAARDYYVRTDGSDSNTGLANTAGGAFLTIQKAYDVICSTLDLSIYNVTINVANGAYTAGIVSSRAPVGSGVVIVSGNTSVPANVTLTVDNSDIFQISCTIPSFLIVRGFRCSTTTSGNVVKLYGPSIVECDFMEYGACASTHLESFVAGSQVYCGTAYTILGNASVSHVSARNGGSVVFADTVTVTGTPSFGTAFAIAENCGSITTFGVSFSGAATGTRYSATLNGVINTAGGGANYFPGNVAGSTATGGQYA